MGAQRCDEDEEHKCPFCSSTGHCPHILLLVDTTSRNAEGGVLMSAFNERWSKLCQEGGDDFDEREPFESLLGEVDSIADVANDYDYEGGPGMSSTYSAYYVDSETKAQDALGRFIEARR